MFLADEVSASLSVILEVALFIVIHYLSPPKQWGDVTQSLIYHQVRWLIEGGTVKGYS
jgi:potassium/chloride transporter 9